MTKTRHHWEFFRAGGFDQLKLRNGADLDALSELDQKLWVALSCPTKGLEFDARTLELLDADHDGRIRASELLAAIAWLSSALKSLDSLFTATSSIDLSLIDETKPVGKVLLSGAKATLVSLGKADSKSLSVEDAREAAKAFQSLAFNGDGVVPIDSARDDESKNAAEDLVACMGSVEDKSGKPGFDKAKADEFFKALEAFRDWHKTRAELLGELSTTSDLHAAYESLTRVRAKVDDFFARCRLAAFDERATAALNHEEKEYLALAAKDLTIDNVEIARFPVARIAADRALPLAKGLNPAWMDAIESFSERVVKPMLGAKAELSESGWTSIKARFVGYEKWLAAKAGAQVDKLSIERVEELLAGTTRADIEALLAEEAEQEAVAKSLIDLEKLVLFHRDIVSLANNFVAFKDFYERKRPAIFQAGTLFLDQRSYDLTLRVTDMAKNTTMAPLSAMYIAFCECTRAGEPEKITIAAVVSAGDSDNLMVGRNGVFYDRKGRDWDATIVKIIDNPISIRQAFWSPYKKVIRFIEDQVNRRAATADTAANERLTATAATTLEAPPPAPGAPPAAPAAAAPAKRFDVGTIAALGVAVGGIAAAMGAMLNAFFGLGVWMPVGFVGLLFAVSGPSMAIAWLKLRRRNLGPILDANGWAVNADARINVPLGGSLTKLATLPPGSRRSLGDPFAEKKSRWPYVAVFVLLLLGGLFAAWKFGVLDAHLPASLKAKPSNESSS